MAHFAHGPGACPSDQPAGGLWGPEGSYYPEKEIIPGSKARTTACVRSETLSLAIMCSTWFLRVPMLSTKSSAIWRLVFPSARSSIPAPRSRRASAVRASARAFARLKAVRGLPHLRGQPPKQTSGELGGERDSPASTPDG